MENDERNEHSTEEELDQKRYLAARHEYDKEELEVSGRYDKWILTLSAGALGLSITFIEKIGNNPTADTLIWLILSWSCFVICLLMALLSLLTSQSAIREQRKELDDSYKNSCNKKRTPLSDVPKAFTRWTNILNWGSLILFVLGTMFLCVFSFKNIDGNSKKGRFQDEQEISGSIKGGKADYRGLCSYQCGYKEKGLSTTTATCPTAPTEKRKEVKEESIQ